MKSDLFLKFFPVPKYLAMPAVGFDVSDYSIKFMELLADKKGIKVGRFGAQDVPAGIIEAGKIKNREQASAIIKAIAGAHNFHHVFISLPEDQAYTFRLKLPAMKRGEIRGSIELQLEEYVPIPPADCVFDYEILNEPLVAGQPIEVAVSVLPQDTVRSYYETFSQAGLAPLVCEIEAQAIARALIPAGDKGTYMIVDIGKVHTGFEVVSGEEAIFTSIINMGGDNITHGIEKNLKVSFEEALKIKEGKGLSRADDNKNLFNALIPTVSALKDEINLRFKYWQDHRDPNDGNHEEIKQIFLCGGQATLPGLKEYLEINLPIPVAIGNPWSNVLSFDETVPKLTLNEALRYTTAIGLALRNFNSGNK